MAEPAREVAAPSSVDDVLAGVTAAAILTSPRASSLSQRSTAAT
jgi:hypothetical protein